MRKPHPLPLILLSLLAFAGGCRSTHTAQRSHQDTPGSFADTAARSTFVEAHAKELTDKGASKNGATARASREWFAQAPVASETPTYQELKRREAQADFEADLGKRQKESTR